MSGQLTTSAGLRVAETLGRLNSQNGPDRMADDCRRKLIEVMTGLQNIIAQPDPASADWGAIQDRLFEVRREKIDWVRSQGDQYGFRVNTVPAEKSPSPAANIND